MEKEDLIRIGTIIKIERKYRNLAQQDLADLVMIHQSTISRMENGDINITIDMYELVLNQLNMSCLNQTNQLEEALYSMYDVLDTVNHLDIENIYQKVNHYDNLYYLEYYQFQLINACYLLFYEKFLELRELMDYLEELEFLFEERTKYIYQMMKACSYHTTRSYEKADFYFKQAMEFKIQYQLEDGFILYVNALNHIILGNHRIAQLLILRLLGIFERSNLYNYITTKRLLGFIYLLDSNYQNTITVLEECYKNKELLKKTKTFNILQLNSFIASAYISTSNYQKALVHLKENIENEYLLEFNYAFLLYCLKKLKLNDEFNYYKEKLAEVLLTLEPHKKIFVEIFLSYETPINITILSQHFNLLYQNIFKQNDRFHFTKLFFLLSKDEIWRNRKYLMYKQFNDLILEYRLGGLDFEL